MPDPIAILWSSFDLADAVFSAAEVASWPSVDVSALKSKGILCEGPVAAQLTCPACGDGHVEEVQRIGDGDRQHLFLACPTAGRVRLTPAELEQWTLGVEAIAAFLASAFNDDPSTVVPGRLWRLATTAFGDRAREILLARGLGWGDAASVMAKVPRGGPPIILVASTSPPRDRWRGVRPAVVNLARVVDWNNGVAAINALLLKTLVDEEDAASRRLTGVELDEEGLRGLVRRETANQAKTELRDDAMLLAYVQHGTTRAAAAALTESGHAVDQSTISRALKRHGGAAEVRRKAELASVEKPVVLQRRNKAGKLVQRGK